jgi:hypothetical protein
MALQTDSVNVRVTRQTHLQLAALARENGLTMQAIIDRAVEAYRRQNFLEGLNADFAALKENADEWLLLADERSMWEQTLADGLMSGSALRP